MEDEFYAVLKLITNEEIVSKVLVCEEEDRTLLLLESPIIISQIQLKHIGASALKVEPWIKMSKETLFIVDMERVITISEIQDEEIISVYEKYLKDKDKLSKKIKATPNMGYISSIHEARKSLEKIFKQSN